MASITEISVEHIHNAYESIRGNIAVEAFYAVVTGFMAVTLIHRLYTVYREVQSNEDGTPTMKDYMNLVWQYVFCIAAVALFPVLLEALETVFGKLMDDLQAGFGGKVYDVADLFQKPIIAFRLPFSAARRLFLATSDGGSAASLPHAFCPRICSRTSSRVGIAPGRMTVTVIPRFFTSRESACENEVSAPFVAE